MTNNTITIKGAKENNLKNVSLTIPRDKLIVFTGVSGSGKTSLAFDTIFAEGQRRYVESLSSYARQFLGQMDKPNVESIEGLSPAISIDQKTTSKNPRSTVGTVTEIYDYLRLCFARLGVVHCPKCGKPITQQSVDVIVDRVLALPQSSKVIILSPVVRGRKGEYHKMLDGFKKSGFARVKIDGAMYELGEKIDLDKNVKHSISLVIDRLIIKDGLNKRLTDSIETALKHADGLCSVDCDGVETLYNTKYTCADCDISIEEVEPRLFSFNSPFGACPDCTGLGVNSEIDPQLIIGDGSKSVREGAVAVSGWTLDNGSISEMYFEALSKHYNFSLDTPFKDLPKKIQDILLYGNNGEELSMTYNSASFYGSMKRSFEGVVNNLERRYKDTTSDYIKVEIERYMCTVPCTSCNGKRLKPEALAVKVDNKTIYDVCNLSIGDFYTWACGVKFDSSNSIIAEPIFKEIKERAKFLIDVGLDYLTLWRGSATLSGGEAQRIRLATQIGSGLMGVLYILDEPSIGLHQRDNDKLIATLKRLRDLGNTLIVVEHDEDTMRAADYIVDVGPMAGELGGQIVAAGTVDEIIKNTNSITGKYLSGEYKVDVPQTRRACSDKKLSIIGATQNNLKNVDAHFNIGVLTAVTGVSGSGKSSLINQILFPAVSNRVMGTRHKEGAFKYILGLENIDKIINIDQSPIGRTPRSNPATYCGVFNLIRELFAKTADARERGYAAGRFSFNVKGGRCENCSGDGIIQIAMHFLPDVYVPCAVCKGKRYNRETLNVFYKGKNIADILDMTCFEAQSFFENITPIYNKIKTLNQVGLGYIKLGQPATTLSGGEAQRVKLATELAKRSTGKTLYLLDEPTTGLHSHDVNKLIDILQKLTDNGNTVIVIEHNLEIIKVADQIIDLGPNGGNKGGQIIAAGTPEQVACVDESYTGQYLKKRL